MMEKWVGVYDGQEPEGLPYADLNAMKKTMKADVQEHQEGQPKLGGRGRAVAIDCTFFTKPKKIKHKRQKVKTKN